MNAKPNETGAPQPGQSSQQQPSPSPAVPQKNAMPDLPTLRQKLADTRQEVRNLTVMGMRPDLPPEKAELIRNLERSARACVKLRVKALRYAESLQAPSVGAEPPAPPPATSSMPSDDRLRAAILLGWQMAIAEAEYMLVQKVKRVLHK